MTCESCVTEAYLGFEGGGVVCRGDGAVQEEHRGKKIWISQAFLWSKQFNRARCLGKTLRKDFPPQILIRFPNKMPTWTTAARRYIGLWFKVACGIKTNRRKGAGCCGDVEEKTFPHRDHHPSWGRVNSRAGWGWDSTESWEMREIEEFPTSSFPPPHQSQSISSQTNAAIASESVRGWTWAGRNKNGIKSQMEGSVCPASPLHPPLSSPCTVGTRGSLSLAPPAPSRA